MMTREEAIEHIKNIKEDAWGYHICGEVLGIPYSEFIDIMDVALFALHPVSRERVERMRGEWKHYLPPLGAGNVQCRCTKCGRTPDVETPFCAWCGAPMTDEAVQMVMERLEALNASDT